MPDRPPTEGLPGLDPPKDEPPSKPKGSTRSRRKPAGQGGPGRPPKPKLDAKLQELIGSAGAALAVGAAVRGDERMAYDAQVVLENAERLASALDKLAQENPSVRRTLELVVATSAWGSVIGALTAVAVPILANHGVLPGEAASFVGAPQPPPQPPQAQTGDAAASPADNGDVGDVVPLGGSRGSTG